MMVSGRRQIGSFNSSWAVVAEFDPNLNSGKSSITTILSLHKVSETFSLSQSILALVIQLLLTGYVRMLWHHFLSQDVLLPERVPDTLLICGLQADPFTSNLSMTASTGLHRILQPHSFVLFTISFIIKGIQRSLCSTAGANGYFIYFSTYEYVRNSINKPTGSRR
jgi:hypothetical protein